MSHCAGCSTVSCWFSFFFFCFSCEARSVSEASLWRRTPKTLQRESFHWKAKLNLNILSEQVFSLAWRCRLPMSHTSELPCVFVTPWRPRWSVMCGKVTRTHTALQMETHILFSGELFDLSRQNGESDTSRLLFYYFLKVHFCAFPPFWERYAGFPLFHLEPGRGLGGPTRGGRGSGVRHPQNKQYGFLVIVKTKPAR